MTKTRIEYVFERLGISWRRAVIPSTDEWTVVVNLQGFLKTFREHAEALYLKELESMQESIKYMFEAWTCPFTGVSEELDKDEGYERNSDLFEFIDCLLEEMHMTIDELITELKDTEDLPDSEPLEVWERKAIAFYHGQVE
jgi:hypothetical protein